MVMLRDMESQAKRMVMSGKEKKNAADADLTKMTARFQKSGFKQGGDTDRFQQAQALVRGASAATMAGEAGAFADCAAIAMQIDDVTELLPNESEDEQDAQPVVPFLVLICT